MSEARDINNINELVGASRVFNGQSRAMYKTAGSGKHQGWHDLGVLGQGTSCVGNWSIARGINNLGLIVGQSNFKGPFYGALAVGHWSTGPLSCPIKAPPVRS